MTADPTGFRERAGEWALIVDDYLESMVAVCGCERPLRLTAKKMAELCREFSAGEGKPSLEEMEIMHAAVVAGTDALTLMQSNRVVLAESIRAGAFHSALDVELRGWS